MPYVIFAVSYLLGAIPFAYLAGRLKGVDLRRHGSGNFGTTNTIRVLGWRWGVPVFLGDMLKGAAAATLGAWVLGPWGGLAGGILAILGHMWNPFFKFQPTGKGVASGAGIILVLMPRVTILALILFVIVLQLTRFVSLASSVAALSVAAAVFAFGEPPAYQVFGVVVAFLVVVRHRSNFQRIRQGREHQVRTVAEWIGDRRRKK